MDALLKPVTAERSSQFSQVLNSILTSDHCELPVLPEAAAQLLRLTGDVNCEPADVVNVIKRDLSLTSHLLRTANSVRYNSGVTVTSIQQAVARLGLLTLRQIVVLISCQCRIFDVPGFDKDVRRSFQRSLAAAAFGQEIARVRRLNVEESFLCGLLHDVGRPVLLQAMVDRRAACCDADDDEFRAAAETHRIDFAGRLVTLWELPSRVADVIRHQEKPLETDQFRDSAAVLNMAIAMASLLLESDDNGAFENFAHPMAGVLNLYPEQLNTVTSKRNEILEWVKSSV